MSTAGKVLSVLIFLATIGWIFLGAGVAQLNRSGNERLAKLEKQVEETRENLQKAEAGLVAIKDEAARFQSGMNTQIAVIRARVASVEAANSRLKGLVNNMQEQLSTVEKTVAEAQHDLEIRKQEKADEIKYLADARAEVQRLRDQDAQMTERLASLRDDFAKTYNENREKVGASSR